MVILKFMILGLKEMHQKMIPCGRVCMENTFFWTFSMVRLGWNLYESSIPIKSQSPEVLREEQPTYASDVFSLGTILYRMLFGCDPFEGDSESDLLS